MTRPTLPLFVCQANCCRSVLAAHLYRHLCPGATALSAGLVPGAHVNDRAVAMLAYWGVDASRHTPRQLDRALCYEASALFVMSAPQLRQVLLECGADLAAKAFLFADPFTRPQTFSHGEYTVWDPSFDDRPTADLVSEFSWMRERVLQIREALLGDGRRMVPAADYLDLLETPDPARH